MKNVKLSKLVYQLGAMSSLSFGDKLDLESPIRDCLMVEISDRSARSKSYDRVPLEILKAQVSLLVYTISTLGDAQLRWASVAALQSVMDDIETIRYS